MVHRSRFFLTISLAALAWLAAACGSGGDEGSTKEPTTPPDAAAIRDLDLTQLSAVQAVIRQAGGGEPDLSAVQYADLTGDGREEAIVPVTSGGTRGNLAYLVLTLRSGSPAPILTALPDRSSPGGLSMAVVDGKLVKTSARYAPEDPLCCPSTLVKTTYYWDGSNLQVEREVEEKQASPKQ